MSQKCGKHNMAEVEEMEQSELKKTEIEEKTLLPPQSSVKDQAASHITKNHKQQR